MSRALNDIDAAIARLPGGDSEKSRLRERARRYHRACGCALGGAFLSAALPVSAACLLLAEPFRWSLIPICLAGIFGAGVLGKAVGVGWAKARLAWLRRSLARRTAI
ncbi:MAG TPA: hypothetical protein VHA10_05155 [Hypericibacter adhaerens]|jgi:hypothetical protein|uniref:Uncharacterized protein n=1 Tax=Hypericibacter adhaerens TaxID=2602016 RepID=A0A5J6MVV8_9PROT|nr:hypothetical protein [Hypericibacter adhaerens]QEX21569.1 hypothetical protein FRZ61_14980 [Hypericibacter adhaerens]HWA42577.1 hypothetical protein [Hypericibacter adhaerens]